MIKLLLPIIFICYSFCKISGQNSIESSEASRYIQLAQEALDHNQADSLALYLQKARSIYLQDKYWDAYHAEFLKIAQASFPKWTVNVALVEKCLQSLLLLRTDMQAQFKENDPREIDLCYQIARSFYYEGLGGKNRQGAYEPFDSCITFIRENLIRLDKTSFDETALKRANHYNMLGVAFNRSGRAYKAVEEFEKVLQIRLAKLSPDHDDLASIYFNLGNAYSNLKLYNKAVEVYLKGIKIREKLVGSDRTRLANVYFNAGVMYYEKGEYDNAVSYYNRVAKIYEENPSNFPDFDQKMGELFNNLAVTYQHKGAYQESSAYSQQAIQNYEHAGGDHEEKIADVYDNLAVLANLKGEYKKAIELDEKAVQLYQKKLKANDLRLIKARNNLGIAYAEDKQYDQALTELKDALQIIEKDSTHQEQYANLLSDIGVVCFKQGNWAEAKAYNLKALEILQKIFQKKNYKIAVIYNNLAKIAQAQQNHAQALQYLQQALVANHADFESLSTAAVPSAKGYYHYDYFVESLMLKARFLHHHSASTKLNALQAARAVYMVADSVLTQVQNELIASEDKIRLSEKMYALSEAAIENCLQLATATGDHRYWEEAFIYAEKSKNTVLTQSITANHAKHFAGIPDSLVAKEDQLQSDIRYYKLKLLEQPDSNSITLYKNELFVAQRDYRTLAQQMEKDYPAYYQLKYERVVPGVSLLQQTLPPATALLSYFMGDTVLYSFVISEKDFQVYRSPLHKDFSNQQTGLRKTIQYQLNEDYLQLAYNLYQQLFPFTLDHNIQSLIIIPDGNLSKLPFETLLTQPISPSNNINFSQLPYLLNQYQISYALSSTLYHQKKYVKSTFSEESSELLAYAPVFDEPQDINSFSSGTRNPLLAVNREHVGRTLTADGKYVSPLPATADEVQSIATVFKEKGQKANIYLFKNANENQFKQNDITKSKYLHIATHGFINEEQPDLSGLLLFPDSTEQEDHILYSGEVYGLNLNAQLVVLSACETGLGKVANGEGLLGLSRAFFYAGAENLIVSLWKVQDRATADLMVGFYQTHLNKQATHFGSSLRQAKLNMIHTPDFSHPYYWSAFVLIGQ